MKPNYQSKNPEEFEQWFNNQKGSSYGERCYTYANEWAVLMEQALNEGKLLKDVAEELSHVADTDGITGYMFGAAYGILSENWIHGEELSKIKI